MTRTIRFLALAAAVASLAGCSHLDAHQQRVLSGSAIGAAGGAALTAITGGPILLGTAVGAAGGAVVGAVVH